MATNDVNLSLKPNTKPSTIRTCSRPFIQPTMVGCVCYSTIIIRARRRRNSAFTEYMNGGIYANLNIAEHTVMIRSGSTIHTIHTISSQEYLPAYRCNNRAKAFSAAPPYHSHSSRLSACHNFIFTLCSTTTPPPLYPSDDTLLDG